MKEKKGSWAITVITWQGKFKRKDVFYFATEELATSFKEEMFNYLKEKETKFRVHGPYYTEESV